MGEKVDPRDFLLNTDYEMDKIVFYKELKYTVSTSTMFYTPHNLKIIPLVFGIWSYNPDFSNSHELGADVDSTNSPPCLVGADYTRIGVRLNPRRNNETFYIKIFGFESYYSNPSFFTSPHPKLPATNKFAKQFILNTDYNYLKLLKAGNFLEYNSSLACYRYDHNLGYVPQVLEWNAMGGRGIESDRNYFIPTASFTHIRIPDYTYTAGTLVTDKSIEHYDSIVLLQHEVRLYCDEA